MLRNSEDVPERFPITAGDAEDREQSPTLYGSLMVPELFDSGVISGDWRPARAGCGKGLGATLAISAAIDSLARALECLGKTPSVEEIQWLAGRIADGEYMNRKYIK